MTTSTSVGFNFESHGRSAAETYREIRPIYERFAMVIKQILVAAIPADCPVHSIEVRAKSVESFEKKAKKSSESNPLEPRYANPLDELTDMAGIRVITFFPKVLHQINDCIEREFTVTWKRSSPSLGSEM